MTHHTNDARACAHLAEWNPIETAPHDGTPMLLFARAKNATASAIVIGWWLRDLGWIEAAFTPNHPVGLVPSLWMPLPAFPNLPPQKQEGTC
ncbi:hypothetical protein [Burkholderia stabilis]|uniref:DUF551 domain-containing protein n=1 Tax=Burkholderia stabilis TaxID=95485 RepID=A0AAJ5T2R3_9BURK|nr:hypothetical protein [Burkholderia stabilis]VBB10646.1 hypothetical protein BSTAB16_0753 [Burkholderia stabilis]VBB13393.1 hypothetical protein BSTAB16_3578 [Burkholderia stabilis]